MEEITVVDLAKKFGLPVEQVIENLTKAGVPDKSPDDLITKEEAQNIVNMTLRKRGGARKQKVSTMEIAGNRGGAVNVLVRKKRASKKRRVAVSQKAPVEEDAGKAKVPVEKAGVKGGKAAVADKAAKAAKEFKEDKSTETTKQAGEPVKEQKEQSAKEQKEQPTKEQKEPPVVEPPVEEKPLKKTAPAQKSTKNKEKKAAPEKELSKELPEELSKGKKDRRESGDGVAVENKAQKGDRTDKKLRIAGGKSGTRKVKKVFRTTRVVRTEKHQFEKPTDPVKRTVEVPEAVTVATLADMMKVKAGNLVAHLMKEGVNATINQSLDQETAMLIVEDMGHKAVAVKTESDEDMLLDMPENVAETEGRAPVVVVMGHVDHGKTTLLDYLRQSSIVDGEAGGITQHVGAYRVKTERGFITFMDTPGHEAFGAMRARGANITDIAVLVVAADDSVKEQTEESIKHARAAGVPIVVAINKIDKPEADIERVRTDLSKLNVISEEWGGEDIFVEVSAKTGENIDKLLEAISLQAEVMELRAPAEGPGRGIVVESFLDKGYGSMAMVVVQSGMIKKGDFLLAGSKYGRLRLLLDENREQITESTPSMPVLVVGLSDVPDVGCEVMVVQNERKAREVAEMRKDKERNLRLVPQGQKVMDKEQFFGRSEDEEVKTVSLIIKGDTRGGVEALRGAIEKLATDEVDIRVVSTSTGGITESDINLAATTQALVVGFNVRADKKARDAAQRADVSIRYYNVIYSAIDDIKQMMESMMAPEVREEIIGLAEVKDAFRSSRLGQVAGCLVTEGTIKRGNPIRVLRDNVVIYEGELESLRRFKDDVAEVRSGTECGIAVKDYNDVRAGDQIEVYQHVHIKREL